ncbi:MAG: hypothetical protein ABR543_05235 [Gemmatimonadaceae bacterium]
MQYRTIMNALFTGASLTAFVAPSLARAQAWVYPSFQHPHILRREFNIGVAAAGDYGTTLVGQWREGVSIGTELTFDVGVADPDGGDARALLGGGLAHRLLQYSTEVPIDLLLTAGLYGSFGDNLNIFRVPFGATIGHRFPLEGGAAITPYVHPRVSVDFCGGDGCGGDNSDVGVAFDIGLDAELTQQLGLRGALTFGGIGVFDNDDTGFGLSLSWKPKGLNPR